MIKKKKKSRYDPWLHALRNEEEEQRWRCSGAKTISPLSMRVCVCLNFEDNDTKRQARLWNQVSQRELENLWNQVEEKKKREENERARELLESSGSKGKKKKEDERMRELLECGSKEKEKGEDVLMDNGICVWWEKCKRKKRKKEKGNYG